MFTGLAIGPTVGSLLIRSTGVIISVFWLTLAVHLLYAVLIFAGLPEPLSQRRMMASRKKYADELRDDAEDRASCSTPGWRMRAKRLFKFLAPLSILLPNFVENDRKPLKTKERDWTLALIAVAYGFTISIIVSSASISCSSSLLTRFLVPHSVPLPICHSGLRLVNRNSASSG